MPRKFELREKYLTHAKPVFRNEEWVNAGTQVWRIQCTTEYAVLHFCCEYTNRAYAEQVLERLETHWNDSENMALNWRAPDSERFYVTTRSQD